MKRDDFLPRLILFIVPYRVIMWIAGTIRYAVNVAYRLNDDSDIARRQEEAIIFVDKRMHELEKRIYFIEKKMNK